MILSINIIYNPHPISNAIMGGISFKIINILRHFYTIKNLKKKKTTILKWDII